MKISKVTYSSLANLGNYENERVELEASLEDGDNWEEVLDDLTKKVHEKLRNEHNYNLYKNRYHEAKCKSIEAYEELIEWEAKHREAAAFMVGQGLKVPEQIQAFPFKKEELLLPATEGIEGEVVSKF